MKQLKSHISLIEQLYSKHKHEVHFLRTPRIMAPADERKINRNEALVPFRKVNSISLRVHHAVKKTAGRWHDMALIMSYVELGIDQEGKSPCHLG